MPYIQVTDELIKLVKEQRKKNKISSEILANSIGKSRAYISQFENNRISIIDIEIFEKMLRTASQMSDDISFNNYIENILRINSNQLQKEEWMFVFDFQIRTFVIPEGIIEFIKIKCDDMTIKYENLIEEINKNKNLLYAETYEPNRIKIILDNEKLATAIRFKLPRNYIEDICKKKIRKSNYINLLGILYNLYLLDGDTDEMAHKKANDLLTQYDIITILERNRKRELNLKNHIDAGEEIEPEDYEVTEYDKEFAKAFKKTVFWFKHLNDEKPSEAYEYLIQANKNFDSDWRLIFAILKLPFNQLELLPRSEKQGFFKELKELLNTYIDKTPSDNLDEGNYK